MTVISLFATCSTAWVAIRVDSPTCREISLIELASSSVAAATVWTFSAACADADATAPVCCLAWAATCDIFSAEPFMREAAVETAASALVAPSLNSRVNWSISAA